MNKQLLANSTEDFLLKYRAAIKVKLTREQLASYLGMLPKSLMRRKQEIKQKIGLELQELTSDDELILDKITLDKFEKLVSDMAESILKIERVNNVKDKTKMSIQKNQKYVITSAQNATPVNEAFLKSLQNYCKVNDAALMVIPYRYRNPTSIWNNNNTNVEWWWESVRPYIDHSEIKVGKHIRIMSNIKMQPTAISPLSGFDTISGLDSAIFGHPNVEWKTIPAVPGKLPKIMTTTGAVTEPNYTDSKAGHKGAYHHVYSAVVLEIDETETFHIRHLTADDKNGFYDLDKYYTQNKVEENCRALALVAGDIHAEVVDEEALAAIFIDNNSIAEVVNPENIVLHDILDFSVRSHHNIRDPLGRFRSHHYGDNNNVEEALQKVADLVESISREDTHNWIVKSNHDEHIERWLKEADPDSDPENAKFYHYLKYHQYDAAFNKRRFDVIEFWCQHPDEYRGMKEYAFERTNFLTRRQNMEVGGFELSLHGDSGPNGARGSLNNLSKLGQKIVVGHSHTPGIVHGMAYQVGTTSKLQLDYNKGPSSWLHTVAVIYPNGTVTLVNVINGKWKI